MAVTVQQFNQLRRDLQRFISGACIHTDATAAISAADATDEGTASTLAAAIESALTTHAASVVDATSGAGAHLAADSRSFAGGAYGAQGAYNAHIEDTVVHCQRDRVNQCVYLPRNGGRAEYFALLNDLKAKVNAHMAAAQNSPVAT